MQKLLVVMAKQPIPHKTKTRLMPALTAEQAAEFYECLLRDKLDAMRRVPDVIRAIAYTPAEAADYFRTLAPDFTLYVQQGADLAERLRNVVDASFQQGFEQVITIDGDSVTLPYEYLVQGFEALNLPDVDAVLGSCEDGGYYALGMNQPHLTLYDVKMSTPNVSQDTLRQAERAGLTMHRLPDWWDVDTPADLARLQENLSKDEQNIPATADYLRRNL